MLLISLLSSKYTKTNMICDMIKTIKNKKKKSYVFYKVFGKQGHYSSMTSLPLCSGKWVGGSRVDAPALDHMCNVQ